VLVERASLHELAGGTRCLVRPLTYGDRLQLARRYERLSPATKRLRFFNAPERLSEPLLDYLTNLDYDRHFALGAFLVDEPGCPGVGVARWVRSAEDPDEAEGAVTVVDEWQGRGIGTLLLRSLAEAASASGPHRFVAHVLFENAALLEGLRAAGAAVEVEEPGLARVEYDVPVPDRVAIAGDWRDPVRQLLATLADWLGLNGTHTDPEGMA